MKKLTCLENASYVENGCEQGPDLIDMWRKFKGMESDDFLMK